MINPSSPANGLPVRPDFVSKQVRDLQRQLDELTAQVSVAIAGSGGGGGGGTTGNVGGGHWGDAYGTGHVGGGGW